MIPVWKISCVIVTLNAGDKSLIILSTLEKGREINPRYTF